MPDNRKFKGRSDISPWIGLIATGMGGSSIAQENPYFGMDEETANMMQGGSRADTENPYKKARLRDKIVGSQADELNQQYSTAKRLGELRGQQELDFLQKRIPLEEQSAERTQKRTLALNREDRTKTEDDKLIDQANALLALVDSGAMGENPLTASLRSNPRMLGLALQKLPDLVNQLEQAGRVGTAFDTGASKGEFDLRGSTQALVKQANDFDQYQQMQPFSTAKQLAAERAALAEAQFSENMATNKLANAGQYQALADKALKNQSLQQQFMPLSAPSYLNTESGDVFSPPSIRYDMTPEEQMKQEYMNQFMGTTAKPMQPTKRLLKVVNGKPIYIQ